MAVDEMKGRIIGREGRNIRAFEQATGVDVIIDDTPDTVIISCFDPVRREVARRSLEALITDGRIHPGRIEELVAKTQKELNTEMQELGEKAAFETGSACTELVRLIGDALLTSTARIFDPRHGRLAGMMAAGPADAAPLRGRCRTTEGADARQRGYPRRAGGRSGAEVR
jgi:hypothetical protein